MFTSLSKLLLNDCMLVLQLFAIRWINSFDERYLVLGLLSKKGAMSWLVVPLFACSLPIISVLFRLWPINSNTLLRRHSILVESLCSHMFNLSAPELFVVDFQGVNLIVTIFLLFLSCYCSCSALNRL